MEKQHGPCRQSTNTDNTQTSTETGECSRGDFSLVEEPKRCFLLKLRHASVAEPSISPRHLSTSAGTLEGANAREPHKSLSIERNAAISFSSRVSINGLQKVVAK